MLINMLKLYKLCKKGIHVKNPLESIKKYDASYVKGIGMKKLEDLMDIERIYELMGKELPTKKTPVKNIFAVIGVIATIAAAIYGVYVLIDKFFLDDYEDMDEEDMYEDEEEDVFVDDEE